MQTQITDTLFMIRPSSFGYNRETATNNSFQDEKGAFKVDEIQERAKKEFDDFVQKLRKAGVQVLVGLDSPEPKKPDAVFPNNWISFHEDGSLITYPMYAANRRIERDEQYIHTLSLSHKITRRYDFEIYEAEEKYLEGTGSMVLDRVNKIVYACLSPRTDAELLDKWCHLKGYSSVVFRALDKENKDIYHTNVVMAMGTDFVVICLECIKDQEERDKLVRSFGNTGKTIIDITMDQVYSFAGNMLQIKNTNGQSYIVMSEQAYKSLRADQILSLERSGKLLFSPIYVIEQFGGGSARCMMAEVFLPENLGLPTS